MRVKFKWGNSYTWSELLSVDKKRKEKTRVADGNKIGGVVKTRYSRLNGSLSVFVNFSIYRNSRVTRNAGEFISIGSAKK